MTLSLLSRLVLDKVENSDNVDDVLSSKKIRIGPIAIDTVPPGVKINIVKIIVMPLIVSIIGLVFSWGVWITKATFFDDVLRKELQYANENTQSVEKLMVARLVKLQESVDKEFKRLDGEIIRMRDRLDR